MPDQVFISASRSPDATVASVPASDMMVTLSGGALVCGDSLVFRTHRRTPLVAGASGVPPPPPKGR